jgi:hypothetical protein
MRAELRAVMDGRGASLPSALPPARRALGSVSDEGFAAFDLRAPGVPASRVALGSARAPLLTPPQSHRIRAVEVLRPDVAPSRPWVTPLVIVLVLAGGGGAFFATKHRSHVSTASAVAARPAVEASPSAAHAAAEGTAASPGLGAAGMIEPSPSPATTDGKPGSAATYNPPSPASLAVRGIGKTEPIASASGAPGASAASGPAPSASGTFGVLAVPEVPKIAGGADSASPAVPPPTGSAPPAASAAPDPFAHAKVSLGGVHGEKVTAADVIAALSPSRFTRCYKTALARGPSVSGQGSLHLSIDSTGHIGGASFAGTAELASIGQCIADAALGGDVKHVEAGVTGADIDLSFQLE